MSLYITSSPHDHSGNNTRNMMFTVILCLIPGLITETVFFGYGSFIQSIWGIIICVTLESTVLFIRKKQVIFNISDFSAVITGFLLGLAIPPLSPWWIMVIGGIIAIVITKQLYGGLGQNIFNPAMIAYVSLVISFPTIMSQWLPPTPLQFSQLDLFDTFLTIFTEQSSDGYNLFQLATNVDGISLATPLNGIKTNLTAGISIQETLNNSQIYTGFAGRGWQWVNLAFLFGGLVLLWKKVILWYIPVSYLISLFLASSLGYFITPNLAASPLFHLFSGASMLGAFFIATDPVTAASTKLGRIIYGAFIGLMIYIIRIYGNYPDGVAYSILIANMCVPFLDQYTRPTPYGHKKNKNGQKNAN